MEQQELSVEGKEMIRQRMRNYIHSTTITQAKIAKLANISTANVSNILKDKWEQISDEIWFKVEKAIVSKTELGAKEHSRWQVFKGITFTTVHNLCRDAQQHQRMLALYGETGYGKTTSLEEYKKHYPQASYYVLCDELMNQRKFLQAIAEELGVEKEGDKSTIMNNIAEGLNNKKGILLMLDDVGKLNDSCLRLIRLLYDKTVDRIGIVLAGTTNFKSHIDMRVRKDTMGFRELHRRIEYWQELRKPEDKVVEVICQYHGIKDDLCIKHILTYHSSNFGKLKSTLTNLQRLKKDEEVSLELLQRIK